jgi:hypothetical protein
VCLVSRLFILTFQSQWADQRCFHKHTLDVHHLTPSPCLCPRLAVNRAVLHKKKRIEASLRLSLEQGKDALAHESKTTAIVFEDYMVDVLNMIAIYCQTLVPRKDVMKLTQDCPKELKEALLRCAVFGRSR